MKPQDIVVLLKKLTTSGQHLSCRRLAESLCMSASNVSESLERCKRSQLIDRNKKHINVMAFHEFLIHGLQYVFPADAGRIVLGVPTYISASPLKEQITSTNENFVWHYAKGTTRGQKIEPLYSSVPEAALQDEELYQLLVIVDTLRIGRVREREIAIEELTKRINNYVENQ
ncbi:MAG: hypothetical protein J6X43_10060 [Bacteroidales bacterium]|nr:hypothetical protein [Bacteroidales bacterium]